MNDITILPKKLSPFTNWCINMGMIPTSYDEAMSYEEQILWLIKYIESEIMPAVNNNANAMEELQKLYTELKNYVDNYFDNLNVQQEINHKLERMVEDGTLDKLINQEVFTQINTDIEELKNKDVMLEGDISANQADIATLNNNVSDINAKLEVKPCYLVIGDSYSVGLYNDTYIKSWVEFLAEKMKWTKNKDYFLYGERRAGFIRTGSQEGNTFITLLNNASKEIDSSKITNILVCGGYNDNPYTYDEIDEAINLFMNSAKEKFQNATVMLGMISNSANDDPQFRIALANKILPAWQNSTKYGAIYLNNTECILKNYNLMNGEIDPTHPNLNGYAELGYSIYNAIKTGYANKTTLLMPLKANIENSEGYNVSSSSSAYNSIDNIRSQIINNVTTFYISEMFIQFNSAYTPNGNTFIIGKVNIPSLKFYTENYKFGNTLIHFRTQDKKYYSGMAQFYLTQDNKLVLRHNILNSERTGYVNEPIERLTIVSTQFNLPTAHC